MINKNTKLRHFLKPKDRLKDLFQRFHLSDITLSKEVGSIKISYVNYDKKAAWILYVELITRIVTQPLDDNEGDEQVALESIHKIFQITREVLKSYGRKAVLFTKISVIILNQEIRPFTSKWHKIKVQGGFAEKQICKEFRKDLKKFRKVMENYSRLMADMAGVEDLTKCYINKNKSYSK